MAKVTAAGKLMLAGEYAVLFEPGRCMSVAVGDIAWATWRSESPAELSLDAFDSVRTWPLDEIPQEGLMGFIGAAMDRVTGDVVPAGGLHVRVEGQRNGQKLGLGSSAATTIATLRACLEAMGREAPAGEVTRLANAVHRKQQGGQGSGYDVVTIAHGGCVAYERTTGTVQQLSWPKGLYGAALYTGSPSSTVAALRRGITAETAGVAAIAAANDRLLAAWKSGAIRPILRAFQRCEIAFELLAKDHPWMMPPSVNRLAAHILQHGGVARTSGAGGGDCVLAWTDDVHARDAMVDAWPDLCVARFPEDLAPAETP